VAPPPAGWGSPPAPGVAPAGAAPAGGGAPPNWNPQAVPAQGGNNGCLKACLIIGVILVVLAILAVVALGIFVNRVAESVGVDSNGNIGTPCPFISNSDLSSAIGSQAESLQLTGFFDATIGLVLDKRVLPNADDCWVTSNDSTDASAAIGRMARYQGSDAAAVFAQEKKNAQPTSQDQGGGITLENPGYFAGDVQGFGDEAFCTDSTISGQTGVLVRKGDTLLYVSVFGSCDQAQKVAKAILH
jgi:hypothetical protein